MDVSDVELIIAVEEAGSLSQACLQLNMSQPTLSKKLARLEHVLGTELFHRYSKKGMVPTDTARYIISRAQPLRAHIAEIERHVELITQLEEGQLNLGVGPIMEQVMLPEVLHRFVASTGNIALSIVTENEETLLSMFRASEVDIVVGPFDAKKQRSKQVMAFPMIKDRIIAVARPDHPYFVSLNSAGLEDLEQYHWVAPKAQGTVQQVSNHPVLNRMKVQSDNYDVLKKLAFTSDVICAGPRAVFKSELEFGSLQEIDIPLDITWESALLVKPETYATPLARHLVSIFEDVRGSPKLKE